MTLEIKNIHLKAFQRFEENTSVDKIFLTQKYYTFYEIHERDIFGCIPGLLTTGITLSQIAN